MKTLSNYIVEGFRINKDTKVQKHNYHPETKEELRQLIKDLLSERGKNADLNDIDVSEITNMSNLFTGIDIDNIDISEWDVSNVTSMYDMFYGCKKFNSDLSKWDVSKVTDMEFMFADCDSLENIPNWYENK